MLFVSVVVPVFNDCKGLSRCLAALQKQSFPKDRHEVIVVDNGGNEGIEEIVARYSQVKLVSEPEGGSYAARNKGITLARGDIIAFTDADCMPMDDWISRGVERLLKTPHGGLIGGKIERFFKIPGRPNMIEYYDSIFYLNQERAIREYHGVMTANAMTFKKMFEQLGLFDQNTHSGGDYKWAARVFSHGFPLVYASDMVVKHPARNSFRALYAKVARVDGAAHTLSRIQGKPLRMPFDRDFVIKTIFAHPSHDTGMWKKFSNMLSFFLVSILVLICKLIEFVRIFLGGDPQR